MHSLTKSPDSLSSAPSTEETDDRSWEGDTDWDKGVKECRTKVRAEA